jgi:putative phage-type endonuclease
MDSMNIYTPTDQSAQRASWLADRRKMITGTDAACILGVSAYGSPISVYMDKLGLGTKDTKPWQEAGRYMEPSILRWYANRHGVPIRFADSYKVLPSPTNPLIGVTLDCQRLDIDPNPPVDAKNIRYRDEEWGDDGSDQFPVYYAAQLAMQMHVTDAPFADLAVAFTGQDLVTYRLHRNKELELEIIDKCELFWRDHIEKQIPPEVDGSAAYGEYLKQMVKQSTDLVVEATPQVHEAAIALYEVRSQIDHLENEKQFHENVIKSHIGEAKTCKGGNWSAAWSTTKDGTTTDWETVSKDLWKMIHHVAGIIESDDRMQSYGLAVGDPTRNDIRMALVADMYGALEQRVNEHTKIKPGYRRFTFNFKG